MCLRASMMRIAPFMVRAEAGSAATISAAAAPVTTWQLLGLRQSAAARYLHLTGD